MTRRTRRTLFYGLFALFLILGTAITLFAEGWRLDFGTWAVSKVGGIYVESFPAGASITLDGKPVRNTTGFLSRGTLINDLFAKNYTLSLNADGYDDWTENAAVRPTLVTEMKYAVLVPSNATSVSPSAHVADFFEAGGRVVTENASGTIATPRSATSSAIIAHGSTIVSHSDDFTAVLARTKATGAYTAYDLSPSPAGATSTNVSALLAKASVSPASLMGIEIDPYDGVNIFVQTPARILTMDTSADAIAPLFTAPSGITIEKPLAISSSWLAFAEYRAGTGAGAKGTSTIVVYDPFSQNVVDASLTLPGAISSLQWVRSTVLGVLGTDGELYRYDVPSETLTKVADDVTSFYPAPDGSAIAALEDYGIEVFSLTLPESEGGYYRFNLPDIRAVSGLAWYKDDTHLFVTYPSHVNFLDFADLSLRNFTAISAVATGTVPQYDAQQNALYLIDQGEALVRFDFPG